MDERDPAGVTLTPYQLAERFIGLKESADGQESNPQIMAMLKLDNSWPDDDSVPWCSCFVSYVCWLLGLKRSKSLRARSWLKVGQAIPFTDLRRGADLIVFKRGRGPQPGPDVIDAPGHVGFFSRDVWPIKGLRQVEILGGNQNNSVCLKKYPVSKILGCRRLLT